MADAEEDIKSNLTVVTPEVQSRKRDEEKDPSLKDQLGRKDAVAIQRKDEKEYPYVFGMFFTPFFYAI